MSASPKELLRYTPHSTQQTLNEDGTLCIHWLAGPQSPPNSLALSTMGSLLCTVVLPACSCSLPSGSSFSQWPPQESIPGPSPRSEGGALLWGSCRTRGYHVLAAGLLTCFSDDRELSEGTDGVPATPMTVSTLLRQHHHSSKVNPMPHQSVPSMERAKVS